jgi:hypothetical protein
MGWWCVLKVVLSRGLAGDLALAYLIRRRNVAGIYPGMVVCLKVALSRDLRQCPMLPPYVPAKRRRWDLPWDGGVSQGGAAG